MNHEARADEIIDLIRQGKQELVKEYRLWRKKNMEEYK
jgi:hypothetical protein